MNHDTHDAIGQAVDEVRSQPMDRGPIYTCPMDPEVRESKPGACPKCGMALEAPINLAPTTKTDYICPMHPEIVRVVVHYKASSELP